MTALRHTLYMTVRQLRNLLRQPLVSALSLVQPIIWLLLYGALFKKIVEIPGFAPAPTSLPHARHRRDERLFSGGWSGMGLIDDLERGVVDRFLVTPASRGALIWAASRRRCSWP